MTRLCPALALLVLLGSALFAVTAARGIDPSWRSLNAKRLEAVKRWEYSASGRNSADNSRRATDTSPPSRVKNITFTNPKASEFYVNGATIPLVNFDVGPSWSGLIPITSAKNETRKLFFWFFPPGPKGSLDDLIFWTNGGPGCSSLEGAFQENGPFTWKHGQALPTQNEWSWTNLSSVLYVEQPIGTGFSQGTPTAQDEHDVAAQFIGFLQQFLKIFKELRGKKFYVSGESYAGMYVPYIANYIYEHTTRTTLDLDLQGIWINDPVIGWDVAQSQIPAVGFVHKYEHVFAFNQTFLAELDSIAANCNYADYMKKYVTYPPKGLLPLPGASTEADPGCDVWDEIFDAALIVNPAFNMYHIFDMWPVLWDVLGFPGSFFETQVSPLYFDREDVKKAIHAPANVNWTLCTGTNVFPNGDASLPPAFTVLPNVIEKSKRSVIVHGLADFILIAEGARIVLQNMTWGGTQGFHNPIVQDSFVVDGVARGNKQTERKLSYVEVALAGHMVPENAPLAALQIMQYLMGFRKDL